MPKTSRIPILLALLVLFAAPVYAAGSVTLAWNRNAEPDVVGYTVFYGTQSGVYTSSKAAGNLTTLTVDNLTAGQTYYFAVQAVADSGLTSPLSAEVSGAVPIGSQAACTGVTATAPATGAVGSPAAFTAQPSPSGCAGAVTYQWSFGDGASSTQQNVSHAYASVRFYTWTLSGTVNGEAVATQTGSIGVSTPPCTAVTATVPTTAAAGSPVAFAVQPSPTGCSGSVAYEWSFGDGTLGWLQTMSHTYSAARSYRWTLSATVNGTAVTPRTGTIAVSSQACTGVTAMAPADGAVGSPLAFTAQPSPAGCAGAMTYRWSFGDGTSSTQQGASHAYSAGGSYAWTLSATVNGAAVAPQAGTTNVADEGCTPRSVLAAPPVQEGTDPVGAIWQNMGLTVRAGDVLRITAAGTWRTESQVLTAAGDENQLLTGSDCPLPGAPLMALVARIGATGTPFLVSGGQAMPVTTTGTLYLAPNDNWFTLWDNSGSLAVTICVSESVPVACTGVTATAPTTAAAGSPVTFSAQPSLLGCTGAVSYQWAFGDGMSSTQQTVSHTYYAAESYTWTLSATVDGVAVAPQTGTIAVASQACTPRTVLAAPPARAGVEPVEAMWQDTGLAVQAGDVLRITAAGTWRTESQALTAAGDRNQPLAGSNCPLPGAPLMALVARIGATGTPFLVRGGEPMPATATGTLYLAPNDNWFTLWENTGSLAVTICVSTPPPAECTGVTATAPATGGVGTAATFTAQPSPPGCTGTATYEWAFGDGMSSAQRTVSHTYYSAESYTWTLSAMIDGVAVAPQTGTIAVLAEACTPRTVVASPAERAGMHLSEAMWQDMGLTVQAGDALRITAAGTWRNGSQDLTAAGDASQVVTGADCPLSGAPRLALVARIGATGTPFLVRGGEAMPVTTTGTLYLAPNDNWYTLWENSGSLAVTICSRQ